MTRSVHDLRVESVRVEHGWPSIGIGVRRPSVSWITAGAPDGWRQRAYELRATYDDGRVEYSGVVSSPSSCFVDWPFQELTSREQVDVSVRVHGTDAVTEWSAPLSVEAGLLMPADWTGRFVAPTWREDRSRPGTPARMRDEFVVGHGLRQARLYVSALGVYEAYLNGEVVGDHILDPGWTSYPHRVCYQTFDVTEMLDEGPNAIGAIVADGWYRGRLGFRGDGGRRDIYGDRLGLLAQLELTYDDGTRAVVTTGDGWLAGTGAILDSDFYDGERCDARIDQRRWALPGFEAEGWTPVEELEFDHAQLTADTRPPIRRTETLRPVSVSERAGGRWIVDFGQNLVGRIRFSCRGERGAVVTLRHAEVLQDGELAMRPLRTARARDAYRLSGDANGETWEPTFAFHGFRYVEFSGATESVDFDSIEAAVCHSDLERTGWFECSDPALNRLHENVVWSLRGNFVSLPTDCPQRDERFGWTGDIQVFAPTACFLYDSGGFLTSWLRDLAAEQRADGGVPNIVPDLWPPGDLPDEQPAAAWADAAVIVPWVLYQRYGDVKVIVEQFPSMCRWLDYVESRLSKRSLWEDDFQYGDWLDPTAPPFRPADGRTETRLVATAYAARSAAIVADAAALLGASSEETKYRGLARRLHDAFRDAFVRPDGAMTSDSQTAYALALTFDLVEDAEWRQAAGDRLAALVRENDFRIGTGFVGTPIVCDALCAAGWTDVAYRLLLQRECPSWLYPVAMGATTIWERWDSLLPDGTVNPGQMTSFNHYAFGAIADWLHRTVAGLAPAAPGYARILIRPQPGGGLTRAAASHRTPRGMASCEWELDEDAFVLRVVVPPNTTAQIMLPAAGHEPFEVESGSHSWRLHRGDVRVAE